MYQIGELILYGSSGVCKVEAIGKLDLPWVDKDKLYYTLCPIYQDGIIYAPIDTNVFMRPVVSYAEAQHLIDIIPSINEIEYHDYNYKFLKERYNELLKTQNCADLLKLIKTIYVKNNDTIKQSRPGHTDIKFMKRAEDLLYGEFAVALRIPKEKVRSYIEYRVKELEGESVNN